LTLSRLLVSALLGIHRHRKGEGGAGNEALVDVLPVQVGPAYCAGGLVRPVDVAAIHRHPQGGGGAGNEALVDVHSGLGAATRCKSFSRGSRSEHFHARAREGSRCNFRLSACALRQQIAVERGFPAGLRVADANNLNNAKLRQGAVDIVSLLMFQAGERFRRIAATQKIRVAAAQTRQFSGAFGTPGMTGNSEAESFDTAASALLSVSPSPVGMRTFAGFARNAAK
jgi:hypothetical protein